MRTVMLAVALLVLGIISAALWIDDGEVVTLITSDAIGQHFETDLWIAEYRGELYLRGTPNRGWVERLRAVPRVELVRGEQTASYEARVVEDPEVTAGVSARMAEKYGYADRLAGAVFARGVPVAVRLDPIAGTRDPQG